MKILVFTTVSVYLALLCSGVLCLQHKTNCNCVVPSNDSKHYNNPCPSKSGECHTLSYYVSGQGKNKLASNTTFYFVPGQQYTLGNVWNLTLTSSNISNLGLVGNSSSESSQVTTVSCNTSYSGILFSNVTGLRITGLRFKNCGFIHKLEEKNGSFSVIASAMLLKYVSNLLMCEVIISQSRGWGLYGYSIVGNSTITATKICDGHHFDNYSGGNLRLKYYHSTSDAHMDITNSNIENGVENITNTSAYAGGIDIYFITTSSIHIHFQNVTFQNNTGYDGGNVAITYQTIHDGWNSTVTFSNCNIKDGQARNGGGIYIDLIMRDSLGSVKYPPNKKKNSVVTVKNTNITGNKAKAVGAGLYLLMNENINLTSTAEVAFYDCLFENNTGQNFSRGQGGAAAHVANYQLSGRVSHYISQYHVIFDRINFTRNEIDAPVEDSLGCGTLYVAENARTLITNSSFTYNKCSGITAVQSSIIMQGNIMIANNKAYNGGGMVLCANSVIFLLSDVKVTIENNEARNYGGGIYAEFECSQATPPCFFGSNKNKTSVFLKYNRAKKAGNSVYGGSIRYCYTTSDSFFKGGKSLKFQDLFSISHHDNDTSVIASDPFGICFCPYQNCKYNISYIKTVYPGQTISFDVFVIGQEDGRAVGVVLAEITNCNFSIDPLQKSQTVSSVKYCKTLRYTISSNLTHFNPTKVMIHLSVENAQFRDVTGNHFHQPYINLTDVRQCPLGFHLKNKVCDCSPTLANELKAVCNISETSVKRERNWWLGSIHNEIGKHTLVYSLYCPFDFCVTTDPVYIHPTDYSSFDKQCAFNRCGILCGRCSSNLSIVLGSSLCKNCHTSFPALVVIGWTLLFALLGILLVLFLGFLNLNVAEGTVNAIIFYMNIVRVNSSLFFGSSNHFFPVNFLKIFVAWINLDLGFEVCYYNGMNAIHKTALQFIFPLYLWALTVFIIYFSHRYSFFARITGKNSVKLLATIILLSYAKIIRTIIDILWFSSIFYTENHQYEIVWKMDGSVRYLDKKHQVLFAIAIIVAILTLVPYTLSLLFIQCLNKCTNLKILFWVVKLKPFFDAHTGPYKDRYHFWTGFLLIVRIALFLSIAMNRIQSPIFNLTLIILSAAALFLINQPGVYKIWQLSTIESFAYFNLIALSIGTAYTNSNHHKDVIQHIVIILSVGSMFFLFCGIVVYNVCKMMLLHQKFAVIRVWLQKDWPWLRKRQIRSLIIQRSVIDSSSTDDEMDPILHNAPQVARFDQYREALIGTYSVK